MVKKQENIDEMSAVAGGSVEGRANGLSPQCKKCKLPEQYYIQRKHLIDELRLRKVIQETIKNNKKAKSLQEQRLRTIIKTLITEAKKDIEDTPHSSTAINLLEDLLKQILPNLETEFKSLTTSKEQRDSFRAHIVSAVHTLIETEDINKKGGELGAEGELLNIDEQEEEVEEEIDVKVSDIEAEDDDKFIDINAIPEPEEEEDTFGIEGQDETGRAMAQEAFNNIEKNIAETYAILHDDEDEELFRDYLVTNLKLYFDKWESELGTVAEPTTDEYEAEKTEFEAGSEAGAELGGELGGETPTAIGGEEVI